SGVIVAASPTGSEHLEAVSEIDERGRPSVFLGTDKGIRARSRFDAAHELGHLILHRNLDRRTLNRAAEFKLIEDQAHAFAGAFLMPAMAVSGELWAATLDGFRAVKPRWNASIAAMIYRCRSLRMISESEERRLWINLNRRGWRQFEPLDDLPMER